MKNLKGQIYSGVERLGITIKDGGANALFLAVGIATATAAAGLVWEGIDGVFEYLQKGAETAAPFIKSNRTLNTVVDYGFSGGKGLSFGAISYLAIPRIANVVQYSRNAMETAIENRGKRQQKREKRNRLITIQGERKALDIGVEVQRVTLDTEAETLGREI